MTLSTIQNDHFDAFANISRGQKSRTTLAEILIGVLDMRTKYMALLAKLDGDTGVADTDYVDTLTPDDIP